MQMDAATDLLRRVLEDLRKFIAAFRTLPMFVKLCREVIPFITSHEFHNVLGILSSCNAGIIVANSLRQTVPPSRVETSSPEEYSSGVIVGEHLFMETYDFIRKLKLMSESGASIPRIVATGGVIDMPGMIDLLSVGANAVQLCTAFDVRGISVLELYRKQLRSVCAPYESFAALRDRIRANKTDWRSSIVRARAVEFDETAFVDQVFDKSEEITAVIEESLRMEIVPDKDSRVEDIPELPSGDPLRYFVHSGNVSSLLLSLRCVRDLHLIPIDNLSTREFSANLAREEFRYDFAILPFSWLKFYEKQKDGLFPGNVPITLSGVARSFAELVAGDGGELSSISTVYHFGGTTSRAALFELLSSMHPETVEITGPMLLPILRFWDRNAGILMKPPLSRIYKYFVPDDLCSQWSVKWSRSEELMLVASRRCYEREDFAQICRCLQGYITSQVRKIAESPEIAAKELRSDGYFSRLAALLKSR
jgi:hypothetical protein